MNLQDLIQAVIPDIFTSQIGSEFILHEGNFWQSMSKKCKGSEFSVCIKIDIAIRISATDVICQPDLHLTSRNVLGAHLHISDFVMTLSASQVEVKSESPTKLHLAHSLITV